MPGSEYYDCPYCGGYRGTSECDCEASKRAKIESEIRNRLAKEAQRQWQARIDETFAKLVADERHRRGLK